ncbi:transcriptional regulator [Cytophagales bacterium WSM2-2]|nr:transcriptional regulator [Cytophagales bacterium WSM2-2]
MRIVMSKINSTPLYCLDTFSKARENNQFYIEDLQIHLKNHDFTEKPHKHDFYLLLYVAKGKGTHSIDFREYAVHPGDFFLMTPGQVHYWDLQKDTQGYIVCFVKDFFAMRKTEGKLTEFPFFYSLSGEPVVRLKAEDSIDFILKEMLLEFQSADGNATAILRSYLELLLLKASRRYGINTTDSPTISTTQLRKLELLIDKHFYNFRQPSKYADLMNISPAHLNKVCKTTLGKTLSDLIDERVVLEAKRLFTYTDLTVSQVSAKLSFSSSSYFIRFFKTHENITPEQFRETLNRATL